MDPETLQRFSSGDEAAIKTVYDTYSGPVYAASLRILRDPSWAADATQQTFLKAWRAASSYDPQRPLGPWIFSIARRTAIDIYRKESRRIQSDQIDLAEPGPSLEVIWEVFEVRAAVEQLADDEREVIRMSHFDGLTHSEIAHRLDIPLGTVKSRTHRAHQKLLALLDHTRDP
ncbi:MAG: sigma-70 family RNA polymerase sigma factor [Acidimicrobiia bacterium]|nr:sigma-70 family RNA polymerase sigma factor [Acidimicrobiia bacterium]